MSPGTDDHADHHSADSAGVPWEGRSFQENTHANDDGSADPTLLAALIAFRDGAGDQVAIVDAYRSARLLIPLVAGKGEEGVAPNGLTVDKTQELSIVTVAAPDGRRVQPVFTSVETLQRWDPAARPVPAEGLRTALAAVQDDTDLIVIDPTSDTEHVLRRPAVWAIGQGQPWEPSFHSADVYRGLQESIGGELAVLDLEIEAGDPTARLRGPELVVRLHLIDGLEKSELDAVLSRLATRWASDDRIAVLVDSLTVKLVRSTP
ncbi:SseB family protein [Microbacterium sp. cx-55]|uniref:SseB family protein n=1 Tax=unclassified Microbacterium TaxID=2609290 RepID=UPI001CBDEED1|nr:MULTISPECIES: SseB family protein [unclassified Microbacterium]MBZ4488630.1 SseB family protein [Microbacterium sp. cx-55]MCC4909771.1 SseB family protein [Microbacterium sp. cx-59]UGB36207.1 SseB family protein [Microbacterium sp. cx-55]